MTGPAVGCTTAEAFHKGVFLILLATLCIVPMNTCAKVSSAAHGPLEMAACRGGDCQQPIHSPAVQAHR